MACTPNTYDVGRRGNHVTDVDVIRQGSPLDVALPFASTFDRSRTSASLYWSSTPPPRMTSPCRPGMPTSVLVLMTRSTVAVISQPSALVCVVEKSGPLSLCVPSISSFKSGISNERLASATQPALNPNDDFESKAIPPPPECTRDTDAPRSVVSSVDIVTLVPNSNSAYEFPPGGSCTTEYTSPSSGTVAKKTSSLYAPYSSSPRGRLPNVMSGRLLVAETTRRPSFLNTVICTTLRCVPARFGFPATIFLVFDGLAVSSSGGKSRKPSSSLVTSKSHSVPPSRSV